MIELNKRINQVFSPDPRINKIMASEKLYPYEAMFEIWEVMYDLMKQDRRKAKSIGHLLTAPSHSGKTTLIKEFIYAYLNNVEGASEPDILYFSLIDRATLKSVMARLCRKLKICDVPTTKRQLDNIHTSVLIDKAVAKLRDYKILLIFDEFEKLYQVSSENRGEILAGFHTLANDSGCPIILVGIEGVNQILSNLDSDKYSWLIPTFSSRFPEYKLPNWKDSPDFVQLLFSIDRDLLLRPEKSVVPFYRDDEVRELILELTEGQLGKIILLLKWTARSILRKEQDEVITKQRILETAESLRSVGWDINKLEDLGIK
jgi:hypothetical protein